MMQKIRNLGAGGFGYVDLYIDTSNGVHYAVKFMQNTWNQVNYKRFVQEINILKKLNHHNIVKVLDYDIKNNNPYYVMPFFQSSLRTILNEYNNKRLVFTPQAAISIVLMLADAMKYAHLNGCIHRDLKPDNILFNDRVPVIADWGIGKFIHQGSIVLTQQGIGSHHYCSPEQWANHPLTDHRTDIYALGVIFKEVLTGSVGGQVNNNSLNAIISKMTSHSPNDRYQSMQEVINAINSLGNTPQNPQNIFWEDVGKASLVAGGVVLGGILLGEILDRLFKK